MNRPAAMVSLLSGLVVFATACSPVSSTAGLAGDLPLGEDGWYGLAVARPLAMPDLVLTDTTGETYDVRRETAGRPTLLFFGYASCPDICPVHLAVLAQAMEQAGVGTNEIEVVFVSADPARDTPESMGSYLAAFDPGFVGLSGDIELVTAAMRALELPEPTYTEPDEDGYYTVGHPSTIIAFDREGMTHRLYPFGTRRAQWVHDLPLLIEGGDR